MLALYGTGVSSGISIGKAYVIYRDDMDTPEYVLPRGLLDEEIGRFLRALDKTRTQLHDVKTHIPSSAPQETGSFIDTHLLILDDAMISSAPIGTIRNTQCNAEWALKQHADLLAAKFDQIKDPYIRSKKTDIRQVVDRIQRNLLGQPEEAHHDIPSGHIVVANDLTPADTVMLKHNRIRGFITNLGGPISHTSILARSLQIPAIVSVHNATRYIENGEEIIIDGKRGSVLIKPEQIVLSEYRKRRRLIKESHLELERLRQSRAVTQDKKPIKLQANIELPADVKGAIHSSASGIGLYRTEFLYMNRTDPPGEEEQFRAYVKVIKALNGKPVTIRTLDLGADKQVDGGHSDSVVPANPALGLRAVRLCLQSIDLFKPQLRAILRASAYGKVRIMIPMISCMDEVYRVMDLIEETKLELTRKKQKFNRRVAVGVMIEVPAAAIAADLFAPHLDFLSIGTNDLIQYTLAIDRVNDAVNYLYDPLHPSILRLIAMTIDAAKAAGIPVSMCGEMAGDIRYTRLLLGMGLDELSMHPATLLAVKKIVRNSDTGKLKRFAGKVLKTRDVHELHGLVDDYNEKLDKV
ncbi:MAG: phosphoenolpyruvate--protein phosphotransferase [Gammaproteobacteria bacterium]|nr:MAG: phosphoenolpyruvate--protein phosphotransferase [Gammaproteobacteria bacterium]